MFHIKKEKSLTSPSGILYPRGEGDVSNKPFNAIKCNYSFATWGEGVRRTDEGPVYFFISITTFCCLGSFVIMRIRGRVLTLDRSCA